MNTTFPLLFFSTAAFWLSLKSLARRDLELHDEIADLDVMIAAIVDELAPELIKRNAIGYESASQLLISQVADFKKL
ncbi:hypothetical protein SDY_P218 (plasmid) [Shigella dysenteriae Sd197]|uniref:Uncharacterized protein n=3 Tax=Shigella dysenteriae TaxID=622 RepID=Q326M7_SHIDS|nr:hypothetical protein SDY_P218 [Shigella dysenteriae Sd197]AHA69230.1 Transposase [Shigella dysenteriae 1617]SPZ80125.1 Uncharacterised protein [Shigella dysenteriae]